jgi:hypothetical protein
LFLFVLYYICNYIDVKTEFIVISSIQDYQLNNKTVSVDLGQAPRLSKESINLLTDLEMDVPRSFQTDASLKDRISSMQETAKILQTAKENRTKDKVIACLKTALLAALVAGVVLGIVFSGQPVLFIMFGWLAYVVVSMGLGFMAAREIANVEKRSPDNSNSWYCDELDSPDMGPGTMLFSYLSVLGGGFVLPLFEVFTRESRLERVLMEQQENLQGQLSDYKSKNDSILPRAYEFYSNKTQSLLDELQYKIEASQQSLDLMKQLSERSLRGETELQARSAAYQKAVDELRSEAQFYHQFDL